MMMLFLSSVIPMLILPLLVAYMRISVARAVVIVGIVIIAILLLHTRANATYECQRLTLEGINVIDIQTIPCPLPQCAEDSPCWDCNSMGNRVCGEVHHYIYAPTVD